jgi:hypothetical protein
VQTPEAVTSCRRLVPPSFGVRICYILRRDRSLRGFPRSKRRGGVSRLGEPSRYIKTQEV